MISEVSEARAKLVIKHNSLIQNIARHKTMLTAQQQKIVAYILSRIDENDVETNPKHIYRFDRKFFCEVCGIDGGNGKNLLNLQRSLEALADHKFWIKTGKGSLLFQWINTPYIEKGVVEIQISERVFPYLVGLKQNFTSYELWQVLPLKSGYSISLYELLKSSTYKEVLEIDVTDLKVYLGIINETEKEEKYTDFKDFRKRVLSVAVEEINRLTDLNVSWTGIRAGRFYRAIRFVVEKKSGVEVLESFTNAKEALDGG